MANLSEEFLLRLKQSNDIVAVMGNHASLKKSGRDFICLCPFHSEKTASCHVYTDSQSFYCFGCGAGGDVITFTRLVENLDYMAAVRLIAERSGISMPDEDDEAGKAELHLRSRIYEINKAAARFFRDCLISEAGSPGLAFLRSRGLTDNTIRKYGLGYAPDSWNSLKYHMNAQGYSDSELIKAFLLKQGEKGNYYDIFRNRVMFPVIDRTGKVIAFSGRRIDDGKDYKYVNTSDTPVYRKGENIFSINFAKNSKKKYMILCEGNIDAVMLNQAGFDNAVAILGTAFTPSQARLLRFYCDEAVLAYDSDEAGEKATVKAINLLNNEGISARILRMDGAKDPDEYIKKFGAASFESLVEKSGSAIGFELDKLKKSVNLNESAGKSEYLKKAVNLLSQVENKLDRMVYVSEVAVDCEVTAAGVGEAVESAIKSKKYFRGREEKRQLLRGDGIVGNVGNGNTAAGSHAGGYDRDYESELPKTAGEKRVYSAEQGVVAFLFHSPDKLPIILRSLSPSDFPNAFHRKLFET
ncbi:MAG: DNA primase, partial [Oscillospiraceae bacterium]|nr:DNA primase [Oscillospiraceae bacterium]